MKKKWIKETVVSARLKEEDADCLKKLADMKDMSVSSLIRNILINYIKGVD